MELITLCLQGKCFSTEIHLNLLFINYHLFPYLFIICVVWGIHVPLFKKKKQQRRLCVSKIGKTIVKVLLK